MTGTLEALPKFNKNQLIERYKIENQFAIPSPFGIKSKLHEEYTIVENGNYYKTIVEKIARIKDKRPIIIFFKEAR